MNQRFSLLTVTYKGDIDAFETLCASIDLHNPEATHYVLVDHSDLPLFQRFATQKRKIIDLKAELPAFREINLPSRRLWFLPWRHLVRGWIYQQIVKIHFASKLDDDAVLVVDSDAKFVRPILSEHLFRDGRVYLYRRPGPLPADDMVNWHNAARLSLGLQPSGFNGKDYISTAVPWSPAVVRMMIARIEGQHQTDWFRYLLRFFRISEYVMYGLFCEEMEGPQRALVEPTEHELCHCSWHYDLEDEANVQRFRADIRPDQVAVLIQSNLGMPETERRRILSAFDA